jgi:aryl-alcohol dehydrogenase-like predicted oxidoreductase
MEFRQLGGSGLKVPVLSLGKRPTVANVIIGARDEAQLRDNLAAFGWNLTQEQMAKLDKVSQTTTIYPY